ncbi:hypothetical protein B0T13DRAFT_277728 [Neurospora crassa]|nr:hypothetical protein B0T13DRAFT_277728 [Neurospora crassa]
MRLAALRSEVGLSGKHDKAVNRAHGITKFSGVVPDQSVNTGFSLTRGMGCLDAASAAPSWMRDNRCAPSLVCICDFMERCGLDPVQKESPHSFVSPTCYPPHPS